MEREEAQCGAVGWDKGISRGDTIKPPEGAKLNWNETPTNIKEKTSFPYFPNTLKISQI